MDMPSEGPVAVAYDDEFFDYGAALLTAVANRNRLVILRMLTKGELSITALSQLMGVSQSVLSQHLTKLRGARLVTRRRHAQTVFYSCDSAEVRQILQTLEEIWPHSPIRRNAGTGAEAR